MDQFWNMVKSHAAGLDGQRGAARFGLVASFDPGSYATRVLLQPENVLTGWLPVLSPWVGAGWGMAAPLPPGTQVLVLAQEGNAEHGIVLGAVWSAVDTPLPAPAGELWLRHQSGSFIKLGNDGSIDVQASVVKIAGDLIVTGNISDQNGGHGTLAALRAVYDQHAHADAQGGTTSAPLEQI
jgi:phage baseplate assembly protein gpV